MRRIKIPEPTGGPHGLDPRVLGSSSVVHNGKTFACKSIGPPVEVAVIGRSKNFRRGLAADEAKHERQGSVTAMNREIGVYPRFEKRADG